MTFAITRRAFLVGSAGLGATACAPQPRATAMSPEITIDQPRALIDVSVAIELQGFPPQRPVTLTGEITYQHGARFQSRATFVTDARGRVDVARQAPTSGTYEGVEPMGFLWSAERVQPPTRPLPDDYAMQPSIVELRAEDHHGAVAEARLERYLAGPGVRRRPIRVDGIVGTLFLPQGDGPHPTVLVVSGGGGGLFEAWAAILASRGYAALALGYFAVEGLPRGLVHIPLEYFEHAIRWVRAQAWLRDGFLAAWGPSRGGELALLLGATFSDINAVVAWVPSGVVFWALGLAEPGDTRPRAAWTHQGRALPYLQEHNPGDRSLIGDVSNPVAFARFYRSQLLDKRAVERAAIRVEKTRGPILLVSGTDDQMWPSSDLADIALRRLEAARHPYAFRHLRCEGAGHLIHVPYFPTTIRVTRLPVDGVRNLDLIQGGAPKTDADASVTAWRETLGFLADARPAAAR